MKLKIEQVGKGGLPPLFPIRVVETSGGKPPFPTCSIRTFVFPFKGVGVESFQ